MAAQTITWVQIVTAVGAIASPIVAYMVAIRNVRGVLEVAKKQIKSAQELANKQVRSAVVSANRQKWIDAVRDDISEFVSELPVVRAAITPSAGKADRAAASRRIMLLYNRIRLRLNPDKPDQKAIIETMNSILSDLGHPSVSNKSDTLIAQGQSLFMQVWRQVKSGD